MEFRLLGPVEAWHDERCLPLGGPKPRALLAALLLNAGKVVSSDRLVDVLWGQEPPGSAHALIQTYVYGLRRALAAIGEGAVIETRPPGYVARPGPGRLDVETFERLVADGRRHAAASRHDSAAKELRAALELWKGTALGGIGLALRAEAQRLEETRLSVLEERVDAELALGREAELVGELAELVRSHPTRERLRAQLMKAMYRLGRQVDAMSVYHEGRQTLADELGVDPGAELRQLYEAMLRADSSLLPSTAHQIAEYAGLAQPTPVEEPVRRTGPDIVPSHLPRGIADFTGRDKQLGELTTLLTTRGDSMTVCVISGKGGVGKSALAVKAAHQVAEAFPDGQLYADLRGVTDSPAPPLEVLGRFLRALGVQPAAIPDMLQERVDIYRSVLAGRRLLVVLDDAGTEQQVRPVLPGSHTCAVLITARRRLVGLDGMSLSDLGVLDTETAIDLLARIAGRQRVYTEHDAAERIVHLCGHLPLALRTAGARLAARPHWSLSTLATRLADERRRLDELTAGDLEVRASVGLSYRGLDDMAKRAFRRLGLLGVPDFASWVVGALLDEAEETGEEVIERLMDAQLLDHVAVDATGQSRYRLHDLLRVYAAERAEAEESAEERAAAMTRALGGWLWLITHAAAASPSGAPPLRRDYATARPVGREVSERVADDMTAWFDAEAPALVVAVERAAAMGLHEVTCEVAAALCPSSFSVDTRFEEWRRTHESALEAARRAGDLLGEATLLVGLGQLRHRQDRYPEAQAYFRQALPLLREGGDTHGETVAIAGIGAACREQGDFAQALVHLRHAGAAFESLGDDAGIGYVNRIAGSVMLEMGDFEAASSLLHAALSAFQRLGSKRGEGLTLRSIALVHRGLGDLEQAERLCVRAVALLRAAGDPLMEAYAVQALCKVRIRLGDDAPVLPCLVDALSVCERHGDRFGVALVQRTIGELHLARGRHDLAEAHLRRSVVMWDGLELPLFRARTMRDLASVREAVGDEKTAGSLRAAALDIFAAFGTREYIELGGHRNGPAA
ncbi:AfsR/SARP family transcriptional regulator [Sphaerisporangium krabiense]|uniref:DNA-binding SARP family transcriptional activator/tetratricopeptide (TPR) repeat protein n=1 Tax=Sphaerisporangium krabiense TaxID=763782 RepID=A0A7W8Z1H9_9ACTN|nr:BTAD domain-containing putative transcriptional regulator [Sphaerisporangium krabiense]MBB5625438.1 DNA-binding SARP family transcriptional activator/tetratricopeptide (TPR) repeat protein [Sphaerisporangium krabiense]